MGRPKSFTEMAQLNLYLPKWQVDELDRLAKLERTPRSKYAHRIIAKHLQNASNKTAPTPPTEIVKPVFTKEDDAQMQHTFDDLDDDISKLFNK